LFVLSRKLKKIAQILVLFFAAAAALAKSFRLQVGRLQTH